MKSGRRWKYDYARCVNALEMGDEGVEEADGGENLVSLPLRHEGYSGVVDRRLEMEREFTGKQREVYRVNVTITHQRMVEHVEEGWIPLPGDREQQLNSRVVREFPEDKSAAIDLWEAIAR